MTGFNIRRLLRGLLLCTIVAGTAGFSSGDEPAPSPLVPIELTQVDDKAIAAATFQSHNQKVVSNRHGIFITYVRSAADNYMAQNWLLAHSNNEGRTFKTLFEETRATSAPAIETGRSGELYLTRPDFVDGNAYLSRFATPTAKPITTTLVGGSAGKYCQLLDEARQRVYFFAHSGTLYVTGTDGVVRKNIRLLVAGPKAVTQYPHLTLGSDGTLYAAWTTTALNAVLYRSIQAMKTSDGGETWVTLDGKPLMLPIVSDESGPTTRISRDDEQGVHSWLSAFLFKKGKLHVVYWAKTSPERQRYLRYDAATGKEELNIEPIFARRTQRLPNDSGVLMTDLANPESPIYFVSTLDDRKRLACLVSPDNGTTWREFAISDRVFRHFVYSIGGARNLTSEGELIGTFTDVTPSAKVYTKPNSGTVYFFRIPTKPKVQR